MALRRRIEKEEETISLGNLWVKRKSQPPYERDAAVRQSKKQETADLSRRERQIADPCPDLHA